MGLRLICKEPLDTDVDKAVGQDMPKRKWAQGQMTAFPVDLIL